MQCLYVAGIMTECLLRRGVHLWEVKNAVFVCSWDLHSGKTSTHALTLSISDRVVIFPRFVLRVVVFEVFKIKRAFKVWVRFPHSPLR